METTTPTPANIAIKWTLIAFAVSVVLTFVYQFMKIDPTSPVKYIGILFFIAFLLLGQKELREKSGGYITFGNAFVEGLLFAVFYGILSAIFTYLYFTIISPATWDLVMDSTQKQLEAKGNLSADQIETSINFTRKYGIIFAFIGGIIGTPIMGAIFSLIGAAIFKKDPQPHFDQNHYNPPAQ